jgi:selenocysteine-specific elongation factor
VLRRPSPPETLGGGRVIDPAPPRHGIGPAVERLRALTEGSPEELVGLALSEDHDLPLDPGNWTGGTLLGLARRRFSRERWAAALERLDLEPAPPEPPEPPAEPPARAPALDGLARRALDVIRADGVAPRAPGAMAEEVGCSRPEAERALDSLAAAGEAVRVKPGVFYDAATLTELEEQLVGAAAERGGEITLAEARDLLGTSRKYAQALLEHLDGRHLTVRRGDRHLLRQAAKARFESAGVGDA